MIEIDFKNNRRKKIKFNNNFNNNDNNNNKNEKKEIKYWKII